MAWYNDFWDNLTGLSGEQLGQGVGTLLGLGTQALGLFDSDAKSAGYQGKIPEYTIARNKLEQNPNRRAGSAGARYFTDSFYGQTPEDLLEYGSLEDAIASANQQAATMNAAIAEMPPSPIQYPVPPEQGGGYPTEPPVPMAEGGIVNAIPPNTDAFAGGTPNFDFRGEQTPPSEDGLLYTGGTPHFNEMTGEYTKPRPIVDVPKPQQPKPNWDALRNWQSKTGLSNEDFSEYARGIQAYFQALQNQKDRLNRTMPIGGTTPVYNQGGIVNALQQAYLDGPTDGMADRVPATIDNQRPARLSHGEMVIPADVVSHMGNGNSEAGAQQFYDMMDRVRKARTGSEKQGKQINPNKFIPR